MLQELLCELELREEHCMRNKKTERQDMGTYRGGPTTASPLLTISVLIVKVNMPMRNA